MLRQAKNQVRIEGILSEVALKYGSFVNKKTGATVDNIGGYIKVLVNQTVNGEDSNGDRRCHQIPAELQGIYRNMLQRSYRSRRRI